MNTFNLMVAAAGAIAAVLAWHTWRNAAKILTAGNRLEVFDA